MIHYNDSQRLDEEKEELEGRILQTVLEIILKYENS